MLVKILRRELEPLGYALNEIYDVEPMKALKWIMSEWAEVVEEKAVGASPENKMLSPGARSTKRQRL